MTGTQRKNLEKALNHIQSCNGECKTCKHKKIVTCKNALCYAFICSIYGTENYFGAISDSSKQLKSDMIEAIKFELSL